MTTLTATYHLFAVKYSWNEEWTLSVLASPTMDSNEHAQYVYLRPHTVSAELPPERELLTSLVAGLRESQEKVLAEARHQHTLLEERIQSLLALPSAP